MHRLERPAPGDQLAGQPVEQLGMAGFLAHGAEVVGRLDDPFAEMVLPDPVDQHARQERVGRGIDHPPGQLEPAAAAGSPADESEPAQDLQEPPRDDLAEVFVTAPDVDPLVQTRSRPRSPVPSVGVGI